MPLYAIPYTLYPIQVDPLLRHRYIAALVAAGTLFMIGTFVVVSRSAVSPGAGYGGITINGVIQASDPAAIIPTAPAPVRPTAVDVPYTKITTQPNPSPPQPPQSDYFDWDSFVSALSRPPAVPAKTDTGESSISDAYAFVPKGLISIEDMQPLNTMSASQKLLYGWGSDVGSAILTYENANPNQPAILTDFAQDRESPGKIAAMKRLGADLQAVGNSIETIGDTPPQMTTAGPALANAYREIGRNLALIPDAKGDEAFVQAILTYNKSAEDFVQKYVAVALIFQANDVKFTQDEPGGVFMFPGN
jgi:hypothetical protein